MSSKRKADEAEVIVDKRQKTLESELANVKSDAKKATEWKAIGPEAVYNLVKGETCCICNIRFDDETADPERIQWGWYQCDWCQLYFCSGCCGACPPDTFLCAKPECVKHDPWNPPSE